MLDAEERANDSRTQSRQERAAEVFDMSRIFPPPFFSGKTTPTSFLVPRSLFAMIKKAKAEQKLTQTETVLYMLRFSIQEVEAADAEGEPTKRQAMRAKIFDPARDFEGSTEPINMRMPTKMFVRVSELASAEVLSKTQTLLHLLSFAADEIEAESAEEKEQQKRKK